MDVVEASEQIRCVTAGVDVTSSSKRANPLPRFIVINFQVPFQAGPIIGKHPMEDHGCSVIIFFELDEVAALQACDLATAPPGLRLLAQYLQEDGHPFQEGTYRSRCLKAVGVIMNVEELNVPRVLQPVLHKFNGKPVLVERETRRHGGADADVVELAVDIRGFNPLARMSLRRLHEQLRQADIQVALTIQGCEDSELPEQPLGIARFTGLDIKGGRRVQAGCNPAKPRSLCPPVKQARQGSLRLEWLLLALFVFWALCLFISRNLT